MLDLGLLVFGILTGQPGVELHFGVGVNMPVPGTATGGPGQSGGCLDLVRSNVQLLATLHDPEHAEAGKGGQA